MFDSPPPRMIGMIAARNLSTCQDDNPMNQAPHNGLNWDQQGHPWHDWAVGFQSARVMMHIQQTRNLALGRGIALAYQAAPAATEALLVAMGRKCGELVCMVLLGAVAEANCLAYNPEDPEEILAIYGAMKQRMTGKPPHTYHPGLAPLVEETHRLAGFLSVIFTRVDAGTVQLDTKKMRGVLEEMGAADRAFFQAVAEADNSHLAPPTAPN